MKDYKITMLNSTNDLCPFPAVEAGDRVKALFVHQDGQQGWEEGDVIVFPASRCGLGIKIGDDVIDLNYAWEIDLDV